MSKPGDKYDDGKVRPSLLPWGGMEPVFAVSEFGARKYSPRGWTKVPGARERYAEAFRRHALACMEDAWAPDPETGLPHMAHAAWNALAVLALGRGDEDS